MIGFITVTTALGAIHLVRGLLTHAPFTSASQLLTIGAVVWLTNVIAFSLWFWDLDAGGAAARASGSPRIPPAFVFPEMTHRQLVPSAWYAQYADYLAALVQRGARFQIDRCVGHQAVAKLMMVLEALVSLSLAAFVVARAINIL